MNNPTSRFSRSIALLVFLTLAAGSPSFAQQSQPATVAQASTPGRTTPESARAGRNVNDGVYSEAQARRGEKAFEMECSLCHRVYDFTSPRYLGLMYESPMRIFQQAISTDMPELAPNSLPRQQYTDILAYILEIAGYRPGAAELPADDEGLNQITFGPPATK